MLPKTDASLNHDFYEDNVRIWGYFRSLRRAKRGAKSEKSFVELRLEQAYDNELIPAQSLGMRWGCFCQRNLFTIEKTPSPVPEQFVIMMDANDAHNGEAELLKTVLQPLFGDFQHWFSRTITLLEQKEVSFLNPAEQNDLRQKLVQSLQEVKVAQAMFLATDGQASIDTGVVQEWHHLVTRCWKILIQARQKET